MLRPVLAAAIAMVAAPALAKPVEYTFDPHHLFIVWKADHLGYSHPSGRFTKATGTFVFDDEKPQGSKLDVTIDTTSLVTGDPEFDHHLKSKDFFDVEKYPTAVFKSTKVTLTGQQQARVDGELTLHGHTHAVALSVDLNKTGFSPISKKHTAGFTARTTIKRSDFGMTTYLPAVGDDVSLTIEAEASPK